MHDNSRSKPNQFETLNSLFFNLVNFNFKGRHFKLFPGSLFSATFIKFANCSFCLTVLVFWKEYFAVHVIFPWLVDFYASNFISYISNRCGKLIPANINLALWFTHWVGHWTTRLMEAPLFITWKITWWEVIVSLNVNIRSQILYWKKKCHFSMICGLATMLEVRIIIRKISATSPHLYCDYNIGHYNRKFLLCRQMILPAICKSLSMASLNWKRRECHGWVPHMWGFLK